MSVTNVFVNEPGKPRYKLHVIKAGTKFASMSTPARMDHPQIQMECAEKMVSRWKENGPFPAGTTFEIEQEF